MGFHLCDGAVGPGYAWEKILRQGCCLGKFCTLKFVSLIPDMKEGMRNARKASNYENGSLYSLGRDISSLADLFSSLLHALLIRN